MELKKPSIYVYPEGSAIAFRTATYTRNMHELIKGLAYRKWDYANKRWLILPQSYHQLIGSLLSLGYEVDADPGCTKLVDRYEQSMKARLALQLIQDIELDLGDYLKGSLYPFQRVGANYMYRCKRAILGDPVGLGKTVMAISASIMALKENRADLVIVVVPANLRPKWMEELEKFTPLRAVEAVGGRRRRLDLYQWSLGGERNCFFLILSYATIANDIDALLDQLNFQQLRYVLILDELQACKHRDSQRAKAAKRLADRACHFYGLSATYIEGRLEELYDVFRVVNDGVLGTLLHFYARHIEETPWGKVRYKNVPTLRETVAPHVLRRLVEDVEVQMPHEVYQEYMISLTPVQRELYRSLVLQDLKNTEALASPTALVEMLRERQCCLSTELIDPEIRESPKLEALKDTLSSIEPESKMVIFCHFLDMVEILVRELSAYAKEQAPAFEVLKLRSGMTNQCMADLRDQFQHDPGARILVTSDVSREGHDLVAARHLFNFDLLWNPASMRQRAGRIIRLTQLAKQVVIHTYITRGTVEEYMWDVVYAKGEVMKQVQDGGREESRITRKTLIEILENYRG